ncbi:hypothetical protein CCR75_009711 [Bremia lactucae]|uniref:Uncharacterized protein n=1 Tax=Bremia lactucae TaxID=4779 RepID=A0A976IEZ8_BRELC|nr:hypothetical protein CCR75_009711 [Bremia lactucae]
MDFYHNAGMRMCRKFCARGRACVMLIALTRAKLNREHHRGLDNEMNFVKYNEWLLALESGPPYQKWDDVVIDAIQMNALNEPHWLKNKLPEIYVRNGYHLHNTVGRQSKVLTGTEYIKKDSFSNLA